MTVQSKNRVDLNPLIITLAGDIMLGRLMNDVIRSRGPLYPWGNTRDLLRRADLALINLECVIAADGEPWARTPKVFHFRADPASIRVLEAAGVDCVSLANNHTLDFEEPALLEMLDLLDAAGIAHTGAGRNLEQAARPAWLMAKGRRVAVISFTDNEPGWEATESTPGVNFVPARSTARQFARLVESVRRARDDEADLVIVSAHWGPNMRQRPSPAFVSFAHDLIDAGADVIFGHSAHIFQGIEIDHGKPILYDIGDFVDDYAVDDTLRNDQSALFRLHIAAAGSVEYIDIIPVAIKDFQVNLAVGQDYQDIAGRMQRLCGEMGTGVRSLADRLRITLPGK